MFEQVAAEIEGMEIPLDRAALVEVFAVLDRLEAKVSAAVGAFDEAGLWDLDGATSMTAWLRAAAGLSAKEAARMTRTARRLRQLPVTSAAWRDGSLCAGQVQAIVANVADDAVEQFAGEEAGLVPLLARLTVAEVATAMQVWRSHLDTEVAEEPSRTLHLSCTLDGRHELSGSLDAEGGAVVAAALRVADPGERDKKVSERQGDALVEVCRWYLDHQTAALGGRHRPHLNIVIDTDASVVGGPVLDDTAVRRLLCDSAIHRVLTSGRSTILDYGTATRTVPAHLWSALVLRDQHCRFPGCDRRSSWCEGHHVRHWADGGPTALDNLVLLCNRHHHRSHQPGWSVKLLPDATFEVTGPDGRHLVSRPPP